MTSDTPYGINESRAISETLDGETIIINLQSGNYYSMNAAASEIWAMLAERRSASDIARAFSLRYEADAGAIEESVAAMLALLEKDGLIIPADGAAAAPLPERADMSKAAFVPPVIERFEDLQEMLLADPIHDVEPQGWPHIKKEEIV